MADVTVRVNLDASTAVQQAKQLRTELANLASPQNLKNFDLSPELLKAAQAAELLKTQLQAATNVNTGRLDLGKFIQQLNKSGMSLEKYQEQLSQFGPAGNRAFASLAKSIAQAETPLLRVNTLTQKMWTSIKNTINWQISSSLIHGVMGQFSAMVNYAKELDTSLNRIRIVTGASSDKMAQFAQQANKAAKELNTTTTAYTDASLIYYQQGLNDRQVEERAKVTVKLANVSGQSATEVSNQMTAIWNNFAKGGENLEHYADVITALGAATASSSSEIATGLEKFAAVADTVGLSYENASAALATITATTRQSADTVGTGLRTLFSRLQSLSLGDTLDDGTNLTKYTKALKTVGVEALDSSGNLRKMDDILADLGEKWQDLSKDQQVALAQTVGGVRQYTTLIALMDNFDFYKSNLGIANTADGTLQRQADIYAESWEAASKRVRVSAEGIYSRLIKSDDFIELMNGFSKFLEMIQGMIDGLGGLKGVLLTLGSIATQVFGKQIASGIDTMTASLMTTGRIGQRRAVALEQQAYDLASSKIGERRSTENIAQRNSLLYQHQDNQTFMNRARFFNPEQREAFKQQMDRNATFYRQMEDSGLKASQARNTFMAGYRPEAPQVNNYSDEDYIKAGREAEKGKEISKNALRTWTRSQAGMGALEGTGLSWENDKDAIRELYYKYKGQALLGTSTHPDETAIPKLSAEKASNIIAAGRQDQLSGALKNSGIGQDSGYLGSKSLQEWKVMQAGIEGRTGKTGKDAYKDYFKMQGANEDVAEKAATAAAALEKLASAEEELANASDENAEELKQKKEQAAKEAEQAAQEYEEARGKQGANPTEGLTEEQQAQAKAMQEADAEHTKDTGNARIAQQQFGKDMQEKPVISGGEALTTIASAATAAAGAVMMLSNAFQVLGNDSATGAQKLGAAMSIIMGLGTLVPAIVSIIQAGAKQVIIAGTEIQLSFWWITLIVAAVAGLIALLVHLATQASEAEKASMRAHQAAKETAEVYEEVKQKAESIKQAFSQYDDAYTALNNCIKYSKEWYEALDKVKDAVSQLLIDFPDLAQYADLLEWNDELGTYVINQKRREQIEEDLDRAESASKIAAASAASHARQVDLENDRNKIIDDATSTLSNKVKQSRRSGNESNNWYDIFSHSLERVLEDATQEQLEQYRLDPELLYQDILNNFKNDEDYFQQQLNTYNQRLARAGKGPIDAEKFLEITASQGRTGWDSFINSETGRNFIPNLINSNNQIANEDQARQNQNRMLVSQTLQGQGYDQATIDITARNYDYLQAQELARQQEILKVTNSARDGTGDNWSTMRDTDQGKAIAAYFESIGIKNWLPKDVDNMIEKNGAGQYMVQYRDNEGREREISLDAIAEYNASQNAEKIINEAASKTQEQLTTMRTNLAGSSEGAISGMESYLGNHTFGTNMSQKDLDQLIEKRNGYKNTGEFLADVFGLDLGDEEALTEFAKGLGFDDWDAFTKNYDEQINKQQEQIQGQQEKLIKASGVSADQFLSKDVLNQLTSSQMENATKLYNDVWKHGDVETANQLTELLKSGDAEDVPKILEAFNKVDWSSLTSQEQAMAKMREILGDEKVDELIEKGFDFSKFFGSMAAVENAANGVDISGFVKAMEGVQTLLNGGAKAGTVLTKQQIEEKGLDKYDLSKLGYFDEKGNFTFTKGQEEIDAELRRQSALLTHQTLEGIRQGHIDNYSKIYNPNTATEEDIIQGMRDRGYSDDEIKTFQNMVANAPGDDEKADLIARKAKELNKGAILSEDASTEDIVNVMKARGYSQKEIDIFTGKVTGAENAHNGKDSTYRSEMINELNEGKLHYTDAEKTQFKAAAESAIGYEALLGILQQYPEAFEDMDEAQLEALRDRALLNEAIAEGIDPEEFYALAEGQRKQNDALKELTGNEKDLRRESEEYALTILKQRKALQNLSETTSKYSKILKQFKDGEKEAWDPDVAKGLEAYKKALSDLYGGKPEDYSNDFITEHMEEIEKAASGDEQAYRDLGQARAEALLEGMTDASGESLVDKIKGLIADDTIEIGTVLNFDQAQGNAFLGQLQSWVNDNTIDMSKMLDLAAAGGWTPVTKTVEVGSEVEDSWSQGGTVYALSADGQAVPVPVDGKVITSGDGTTSYDVIVGWQKTGPGGSPGGGGGGGGGGKKKKDHKKPDTGTRYHKINAKQANNSQNKSEVSRKKDRAFGAEKIKQAQKEIELQKEAIELQRQYVDEINDYLAGDRVKMIEAFTPDKLGFDLGFNLQIDKDGVITNYRQLEEKLLEEENKLIDKYNDGGLDDEAYEEAQKKIDEAREYLKIYEETRDLYEEEWIKLAEYLDELADSALELTKLKIDLDISISDDTLGLLDYMLEKIEDNAYKAAEAISLLGDKTNETLKRVDIYQSGLEEILNSKGLSLDDLANITDEQLINGDFTQAQIDQIREWRDAILDADKELLQMREDIIDKIIDAFNELNDKVQESYDQFDNYNSIIEDYTNITDLLAIRLNQQQKELIKMLGQAALNNAQTQAAAARDIYEEALANQQAAQKAYEQAVANGDTEAMRQWEKVVKETQTVLDDAQQQWLEAWQAALEKAQELYTKAIEDTVKAFEESVSGAFGALDYLQSAFDRMGQTNDQYLQDFEKLYELNKLNRDIQNAIDDTTNIRDKQALRDLQKEINRLQKEGVELSQYDVDALRKKFELEQARLALEDARNAKSEVRLQRDANGNWGYVYTAKEDEVAKAEQEYEDKLYEYQKLNDEYITELQSRVLETQTTYKDALAEIYNDTTLTDAQREARINELNNWLQAELSYFEQQLNNAMDNQQGTLDLYYNKYNDAQAKLADSWDETTLRMLIGAESIADYMNNVKKSVEDMLQSSSEALNQYNKDVDETNHMAGVETEDYGKEVSDAITTIGNNSTKTKEEIAKLSEELKDNFVDSLKEAINWEEEYANKINAAVDANESFIKSINEMIAKLAELESSNPGLEKARTAYQAAEMAHEEFVKEHGENTVDKEWEQAKGNWQSYLEDTFGIQIIQDEGKDQILGYELDDTDEKKIDAGNWVRTGKYETDAECHYPQYRNTVTGETQRGFGSLHDTGVNDNGNLYCSICGRFMGRERNGIQQLSLKTGGYIGHLSNISSAKTGMYTGSWDGADIEENGRLAFLHQKELVLNADDTQNFLDATKILRTIDLSTDMFSKGLGNIITPWISDMRQQDLEQNVHIEASFPNVTEHNEIERAFDNLINRAAQYVNRK